MRRLALPLLVGVLLTASCARTSVTSNAGPDTAEAPHASEAPTALACVADLPEDVRIGQTMLVSTTDLPRIRGWLADGLIAGILASGTQTRATAKALEKATAHGAYGALLAVDEEGGAVQRYRVVAGAIPSAQRQATTMTPHQVRTLWAAHAAKLSDWGVDLVMAPVVDVGHGPGIGPRAFSAVPEIVSEFGLATTEGISEAGLLPVLKHFPGHGKASGDSHYEIVAGPGLDALRESDLLPYKAIIGKVQVGVMVGHTTIPGYSERPSSQSPVAITKLLREELGFSGLVVSDALGMAAAGEPTQGDALVGFIAAGGDLGIVGPGGSVEGRAALRSALKGGRVSEARLNEATAAVFGAKGIDPCELEVSPSAPDPSDSGSQPPDEPVRNPTLQP